MTNSYKRFLPLLDTHLRTYTPQSERERDGFIAQLICAPVRERRKQRKKRRRRKSSRRRRLSASTRANRGPTTPSQSRTSFRRSPSADGNRTPCSPGPTETSSERHRCSGQTSSQRTAPPSVSVYFYFLFPFICIRAIR